jgi:hypothetical protein
MRFLANENFPGSAVTALTASGHDVLWVRTVAPGMSDPGVLAWAGARCGTKKESVRLTAKSTSQEGRW